MDKSTGGCDLDFVVLQNLLPIIDKSIDFIQLTSHTEKFGRIPSTEKQESLSTGRPSANLLFSDFH
jgi:hypothetical protein